jgi:hypothetical protein
MPNYTKKRNKSGRKGRGLSERVLKTMRRFLPWSSKPQYMPVEVPPMKTPEEPQKEFVHDYDLPNRETYYPKSVPVYFRSMIPFPKDERWKKHDTIKKKPQKLPNLRRSRTLRSSRKLRSSTN